MAAHPVKHRIGDKIAHGAFHYAADRAVAFDEGAGRAHHLGHGGLDRAGQFGNTRGNRRIRRDRGVQQHCVALGIDHRARIVEGDGQMAQILGIGIGLHDRHQRACRVADPQRIGPVAVGVILAEIGVGMAAHDHIDARYRFGDADIGRQAHMGQRDDLIDTLRGQRIDIGLQGGDLILEDHVRAGRRDFLCIARQRRDDTDLHAVHIQNDMILHPARKRGIGADIEIARQDRKADRVKQRQKPLGAVVELVIAQRHGVKADGLHELARRRTAIGGEEQAALILIARIENDHILACRNQRPAQAVHRRGDPRHAAETLASRVILGGTRAVEAVDRLDTAVQIVDVQNMQCRFGMCRRRGGECCDDSGASKDSGLHGDAPIDCYRPEIGGPCPLGKAAS